MVGDRLKRGDDAPHAESCAATFEIASVIPEQSNQIDLQRMTETYQASEKLLHLYYPDVKTPLTLVYSRILLETCEF